MYEEINGYNGIVYSNFMRKYKDVNLVRPYLMCHYTGFRAELLLKKIKEYNALHCPCEELYSIKVKKTKSKKVNGNEVSAYYRFFTVDGKKDITEDVYDAVTPIIINRKWNGYNCDIGLGFNIEEKPLGKQLNDYLSTLLSLEYEKQTSVYLHCYVFGDMEWRKYLKQNG